MRRTVHPRVCGGNDLAKEALAADGGPSPRVRGKLAGIAMQRTLGTSIPECAGETSWMTGRTPSNRVHPRVCGGNQEVVSGA